MFRHIIGTCPSHDRPYTHSPVHKYKLPISISLICAVLSDPVYWRFSSAKSQVALLWLYQPVTSAQSAQLNRNTTHFISPGSHRQWKKQPSLTFSSSSPFLLHLSCSLPFPIPFCSPPPSRFALHGIRLSSHLFLLSLFSPSVSLSYLSCG